MRELSKMLGYKSPRSASVIIEGLIQKGMLKKKDNGKLMLAELEASEEITLNFKMSFVLQ
jgi:hypothetical protein